MSDHKALLKHSRNYLIANLATKALLFISIPIYTRLLSVEEYGIINVFMSTIAVASVLLTMNTEVAISRYYYDSNDINEFKRFVGSSVNLVACVIIVTSAIFLLFVKPISELLSFNVVLTISILPVALYSIINSIFEQIYNPMLQSKRIAIVSSVKTYLAFALSIVFILLLKNEKYMGYVWGTVLAMFVLAIYLYRQIRPYYTFCFDTKHLKYILVFSLPYLPYSLSGVIIAQFGRLLISNDAGFETAGVYSFASNISMILLVFIGVVHQAWNPYYFRYMNDTDYKSIDVDYDMIWRITLLVGVGVSIFGQEIGWIMGGEEYWESLYILPLLVSGYVFYQWAYVYMRNCIFAKRTFWNAISVVAGGISNVIISYFLIPIYGVLGVSLAFCVSYLILLLTSYISNKFILRVYVPSFWSFLKLLIIALPFWIFSSWMYFWNCPIVLALAIKLIAYCIICVLFLYQYKTDFLALLRPLLNGKE